MEQIRDLMAGHPDWSRWRLSEQLAILWNWRNAVGQLKDMAARTLLLKLEQRGWIVLPARRRIPSNRMRQKRIPTLQAEVSEEPLVEELGQLLPLEILEISRSPGTPQRALFENLLHQHHYLSYRSPVGENLQYLVNDSQGRPAACVLFGAAAWQCADRDAHIGWDAPTRAGGLGWIANNTRFLILPWVRVPLLASHLLSRIARRLSRDWQGKYGHPIYLLETFVEQERFTGTCYRAANWRRVGQTKGRSRQNRPDGRPYQVPIKDVYLYPLHPHFQRKLQGCNTTSNPYTP
ncbi:MAG: Druantia anti-phage system protein DruA [Armatimonadota bacterium]